MYQISQQEYHPILLWYLLQHSVSSYQKLLQYFHTAEHAVAKNALPIWQQLKLHKNHLARFNQFHQNTHHPEFDTILQDIQTTTDHILIQGITVFPEQLQHDSSSPPILFVQGCLETLLQPQIAIVGSRNMSPHGGKTAYDFAEYLAQQHYVITSGLALGIDTAAHYGAIQHGQSIAVIATGLEQCYPSQNKALWQQIIENQGAIVSEFLPNTALRKEYFPRRNRIMSGLSQGCLVVEAGLKSGSLITAKLAAEQGKQVFAIPGHIHSPFHQGCHQLIREGVTLVDHPQQIIDDLNFSSYQPSPIVLATSKTPQIKETTIQNIAPDIPFHLQTIYEKLDWEGISIDTLALQLNLEITELNVALVELELLGYCKQYAGRFLRC